MGLKAGLWLWLPWWWDSKETTCNMGDLGSVPGWGRSPGGGHGNPLQYSCMENPMDRGALWAHGAAKSRTQLRNFHFWLWVLSGEYFFSPLISRVATYYKSFHAFLRKFVCLFVSFVLCFFFVCFFAAQHYHVSVAFSYFRCLCVWRVVFPLAHLQVDPWFFTMNLSEYLVLSQPFYSWAIK